MLKIAGHSGEIVAVHKSGGITSSEVRIKAPGSMGDCPKIIGISR